MNSRIGKLFEIIQLFVDNFSTEPETANLFKLLSLDISPCLQGEGVSDAKVMFFGEIAKCFPNKSLIYSNTSPIGGLPFR